ncbi:MAG TPA: hypothetical protein VF767_12110 [Bryobacteraceae bacterium]
MWPSEPPAGCPFPRSNSLAGIRFTGTHARYTNADTWYPSWASDGNLYSPWTDGKVGEVESSSFGKNARTGHATIVGDSPLDLKIVNAATYPGDPMPYGGRYPCGSLVHNGVWYYGTYCLMDSDGDPSKGLNWDILGPFVGFRQSTDFGKTWTDTPHTPARPIFGEPGQPGFPVKIGSPHFVDFGKNLQHSPDGKAYLVGHGAVITDPTPRRANLSWITGDQIYMLRVEPSPANMNDPAKYEFFAGHDRQGRPVWSRRFADLRPVMEWDDRCGCVTMTYNAPLKKHLMCVTDGRDTISRFNTYILESDAVTGPWKLVVFMQNFGEQSYFVNIPSKFIGASGRDLWLLYAANFWPGQKEDPPGSGYGMCLQEVRLLASGE